MPVDDSFSGTSGASTTSSGTLVLTVPRAVAVGKKIVLATDRADQAYPTGLASIVDSRGNTWHLADALSLRANIVQIGISHCDVTTALQAGDTITITWSTVATAKKNAVALVCSGLASGGPQATTGASVTAGVSGGPNGSSSSPSGSLTTTSACLVVGAFGSGSSSLSPGAGFTAGPTVSTSSGTGDRALCTEYLTATTAGTKTVNASYSSSATWAEAAVAFALASTPTNNPPTVNAGPDQTVEANSLVTLTFVGTDTDGTVVSYACTQTAGTTVTLSGSGPVRTFTAPHARAGSTLTFSVTATDDGGAVSTPDTVTVTVLPVPERIVVSGALQSARWGIVTGAGGGGDGGVLVLTADPDPGFVPPRIRVGISDQRDTVASSVTVTRRNADGSTATVRTADSGPLPLDGGQGAIYDYEAPFGEQVTYYTDADAGAVTVSTELDVDRPWLIHPGIPSRSVSPFRMAKGTDQSSDWDVVQGSFTVLRRSTPVITSGGARVAPASTLVIISPDPGDLATLKLLLSDASPLFLNVPASLGWGINSCYIAVGKVQVDRFSPMLTNSYRSVTLPYQVVARPAGGTQATYTWNDVAQTYATWQAIIDAGITSWAELANPVG